MEDVSHLTGENMMKRAPKNMILNEIRFNGKDGMFTYFDLIGRKEGEKAKETKLGESINIVILKMRRRIQGFSSKEKKFFTSTEHNGKDDTVYLFGAKEKGKAEELYNKYNANKIKMQAQRVIYCFLIRENMERELVRLIIKGSTLNSERVGKNKAHMDFFDYTQREKAKDEHIYMFVTKVYAGEEKGNLGAIAVMYFKPASKIAEEKMGVVIEKIKELAEMSNEQDAYYKVADSKSEEVEKT